MDSTQLFGFLSRPRTIREVAERFGLPIEQVEQFLREPLETGRIVVSMEGDRDFAGKPIEPGQLVSLFDGLSDLEKGKSLPTVQSRVHDRNDKSSKYQKMRFKFKAATPSVVKRSTPTLALAEIFRDRESVREEPASRVSLSLETRLLDALTLGPKTIMELRLTLGVTHRNLLRIERKGYVEAFWGTKGVGRMFRLTRKGSIELKRLKTMSSIDHKMTEKQLITLKKITAPFPI